MEVSAFGDAESSSKALLQVKQVSAINADLMKKVLDFVETQRVECIFPTERR
jgi:hypothetical protein